MFLQSQFFGKFEASIFSQDIDLVLTSPSLNVTLGSLMQVPLAFCGSRNLLSFLSGYGPLTLNFSFLGSFFSASVVLCLLLVSTDQVSSGTAQAQSVSMERLFFPLTTLKKPCSPHEVPHEFLATQYLTPFSTPQPTTEIS